jgi:hypothetical protein
MSVAAESQCRTSYNVALVALSEAKGTLLADRDITVVEGVQRARNSIEYENANPPQPTPVPFGAPTDIPFPAVPAALAPPARSIVPEKTETNAITGKAATASKSAPKVWSFSFSIGRDKPLFIKGTISDGADDRRDAVDH